MYSVAQIPSEQKKDEPERNEENADNKAMDQNVGKDFQIAYETRRLIHWFPPVWFLKWEKTSFTNTEEPDYMGDH
jgi:hypothetical protein